MGEKRTKAEWDAIYESAVAMNLEHATTGAAIKPCPHCGGAAQLEDMGWPHHVYCTECGSRVTGAGYGEAGEADAIRRWNRRVGKEVI